MYIFYVTLIDPSVPPPHPLTPLEDGCNGSAGVTMLHVAMTHPWSLTQLGGDTPGALSGLASAIAGNVSSLVTARQFLPEVTLDVPTLMALVVVFTFLIQFYFTVLSLNLAAVASASSSASSSSSTTITSTTTTATAILEQEEIMFTQGAQTVTPAPAPEWRFHRHRLGRRSLDSPAQLLSSQPWHIPHYVGLSRRSDGPQVALRRGRTAGGRRTGPRRMSLLYEVEDSGSDEEALSMMNPLTLSSHRVSVLPENTEVTKTNAAGLVSSVLYGAERWGDRLQEWNILSPDGAQAFMQTLLMVRCAFISPDFCAKLDHYFRRQHDLNLVAAMMNDHIDYDDHSTWLVGAEQPDMSLPEGTKAMEREAEAVGDKEVVHLGKFGTLVRLDKGSPRTDRPGKLEAQGKIGAVGLVDQQEASKQQNGPSGGVRRPGRVKISSITRSKVSPVERHGKRRVAALGASGTALGSGNTWGVYVVVTLAAVVLLVMEATQRLLQFVSRPGRALHRPHSEHLETLAAALHRWRDLDDP